MKRLSLYVLLSLITMGAEAELLRKVTTFDGVEREWFVQLPDGFSPARRYPLVIVLHGSGGSGNAFAEASGWGSTAETNGFIAVFPTAAPPQNIWNIYYLLDKPDDLGWLRELIELAGEDFGVDSRRVFMTGFSNGAAMTNTFAGRHSSVLTGIAPVMGSWITAYYSPFFDSESLFTLGGPLPVWIWRGELETHRDGLGLQARDLQDLMQKFFWMLVDRTVREPRVEREGVYRTDIFDGPKADVRFTEIAGRGHSYDPQSTTMIWTRFFSQLEKPAARRRLVRH